MSKFTTYALLTGIALSTLFTTGCGESTNEISAKDKVIVLHDVGLTGCLALENFGNSKLEDQNTVTNVTYTSTGNNVSCATYGKTETVIATYADVSANLDAECAQLTLAQIQATFPEEDLSFFENNDKACVLSFDLL